MHNNFSHFPVLQLRRHIALCDRQCNAASITTPYLHPPCQQTLAADAALPLPDCPQASAVGDFDQAADRWRDVLRAYPGRPALWRAYLAFRQTHFASFSARKLRHLHDDAMDVRVSCVSCREDAVACRVLHQNELHRAGSAAVSIPEAPAVQLEDPAALLTLPIQNHWEAADTLGP